MGRGRPGCDLSVDLGDASSGTQRALLAEALEADRQVRLRYYTLGRDRAEERVVDPWLLRNEAGHWYLSAYCHRAEAPRTFRLDRVLDAEVLDSPRRERAPESGELQLRPDDDAPLVELRVAEAHRWITEAYPVESVVEGGDGTLTITLAVTGEAWLSRLLLRLGPDAEVLTAPGELRFAGRTAAQAVLARYDRSTVSS
ncbi:MAG: WYL domain-containing protein [Microthrixaceae bacterium]